MPAAGGTAVSLGCGGRFPPPATLGPSEHTPCSPDETEGPPVCLFSDQIMLKSICDALRISHSVFQRVCSTCYFALCQSTQPTREVSSPRFINRFKSDAENTDSLPRSQSNKWQNDSQWSLLASELRSPSCTTSPGLPCPHAGCPAWQGPFAPQGSACPDPTHGGGLAWLL